MNSSYTHAIVSVTYKCNSRCIMCNIWKKKVNDEVNADFYLKLPKKLIDINITGGEPFLRIDLDKIVHNILSINPKTRIIINTNGLMSEKISSDTKKILSVCPAIAIRISLDGPEKIHNSIRGIPGAYKSALETISRLRKIGVKDLGVSFTLMEKNLNFLFDIFNFAKDQKLEFSLTVATDSSIYFGKNKRLLRPNFSAVSNTLNKLSENFYRSFTPKNWARGWFVDSVKSYLSDNRRPFICDAGNKFFYLDPYGNIFTCHLKNWYLGNLKKNQFSEIITKSQNIDLLKKVKNCNDCWMICTAKTSMLSNKINITKKILINKLKYW